MPEGKVQYLTTATIDEAIDSAGICLIKKNDKKGLLLQRCDMWLLDLDMAVCYGKKTRKGFCIQLRLAQDYGDTTGYHISQSPITDRKKLPVWLEKLDKKPSDEDAVELLRKTLRNVLELICKHGLYLKLVYYGDGENEDGTTDCYGEHEWHLGRNKIIEFERTACRYHQVAINPESEAYAKEHGWVCIQN